MHYISRVKFNIEKTIFALLRFSFFHIQNKSTMQITKDDIMIFPSLKYEAIQLTEFDLAN